MNGHDPMFFKEPIKPRNRAGISPLPKLNPEDNKPGIRIPSAHVVNELNFIESMLVWMMVRSAETVTQRLDRVVIATFPAVNVLPVGFVFDSSFGNTTFLGVFN